MNLIKSLKRYTTVVADTGDLEAIAKHMPQDASSNPWPSGWPFERRPSPAAGRCNAARRIAAVHPGEQPTRELPSK
jgi:hypothetical protein